MSYQSETEERGSGRTNGILEFEDTPWNSPSTSSRLSPTSPESFPSESAERPTVYQALPVPGSSEQSSDSDENLGDQPWGRSQRETLEGGRRARWARGPVAEVHPVRRQDDEDETSDEVWNEVPLGPELPEVDYVSDEGSTEPVLAAEVVRRMLTDEEILERIEQQLIIYRDQMAARAGFIVENNESGSDVGAQDSVPAVRKAGDGMEVAPIALPREGRRRARMERRERRIRRRQREIRRVVWTLGQLHRTAAGIQSEVLRALNTMQSEIWQVRVRLMDLNIRRDSGDSD